MGFTVQGFEGGGVGRRVVPVHARVQKFRGSGSGGGVWGFRVEEVRQDVLAKSKGCTATSYTVLDPKA